MIIIFLLLIGVFVAVGELQSENSGYEQAPSDITQAVSSNGDDQQAYNSDGQVANDSPKGSKKTFRGIKVKFQPDVDTALFPGFTLPDANGIVQQVFTFNTRVEVQGDAPQKQESLSTGNGYKLKKY